MSAAVSAAAPAVASASAATSDAAKSELRRTLGRFATGVGVIAAQGPEGPVGVLVNSFTSVSLAPPTVLFCIATTSRTWPHIERAGTFAASFLREEQRETAERFWRSETDRFAGVATTTAATGAPVLADSLGYVDCRVREVLRRDDHYLVLGSVVEARPLGAGSPLLFFDGSWNTVREAAS
ncbi:MULTISPECIES: flavin reductase family protein [Streptomyces]|uniref:Monooxygenase n=1 Tax=Streptomyces badius TaxID=1941 RepID=A0ABQ2TNW7_STRBA|nr:MULTISPECIES: flavin reductase family protein [Streptomyces]GGS82196.1 monooxygenase [Streptomyces badius]